MREKGIIIKWQVSKDKKGKFVYTALASVLE
jgi:hypothetical protein